MTPGQVIQTCGYFGMLLPKHALTVLQSLLIQRQRFDVVAHVTMTLRQVVEGQGDFRGFGSVSFHCQLPLTLGDRQGIGEFAGCAEQKTMLIEAIESPLYVASFSYI
eukprot:549028-Pyramimonas_sp.AAC.1